MSIILCGLPFSGKTTTGKMLAETLNWLFIDTDQLIEEAYAVTAKKKCTCRQIFANEGELAFRELEKQQIANLSSSSYSIISIGGGALGDKENVTVLRSKGDMIYLKTPLSLLWKRLQKHGIPAYLNPNEPKNAFFEMAKNRTPLYEAAAQFTIETSHSNQKEIGSKILRLYGK